MIKSEKTCNGWHKRKALAIGAIQCEGNIVIITTWQRYYKSKLSRFLAMLRKPILPSSNS